MSTTDDGPSRPDGQADVIETPMPRSGGVDEGMQQAAARIATDIQAAEEASGDCAAQAIEQATLQRGDDTRDVVGAPAQGGYDEHESAGIASQAAGSSALARTRFFFFEWLWRSRALSEAKAALEAEPATAQHLARARIAAELAESICGSPALPDVEEGARYALAVSLFREAACWALLAYDPHDGSGHDFGAMFDRAAPQFLASAATSVDSLMAVRHALIERTFVETAALPAEEQARDAREASAFVAMLRARLRRRERDVGEVLAQRVLRIAATAAAVVLVIALVMLATARTRGPNFVAGKPWKASSSYGGFATAVHRVDGNQSAIFFHTEEEQNPWVQFDLGAVRTISRVEVTNRVDCCSERAVPLVVEVSEDAARWREVARKGQDFRTWDASFAPTRARYVRLRVLKKTWFHLENVAVR